MTVGSGERNMQPSRTAAVATVVIAVVIAARSFRGDPGQRAHAPFAHPPRTRFRRALHRAPIALYRLGLGGLLGRRFVLLTHIGRRTGASRQVVLEVVGRHGDSYLVASGYGPRAQWYRNILADPRVRFQIGRHRHTGHARPLAPAESGRRLAGYARSHPRTAAALMRTVGQAVDGSPASYQRVGADPAEGVPLVALTPLRRPAPGPRGGSGGTPAPGRVRSAAPARRCCPAGWWR